MRFLSVALGGLLLGAAFPALAQTAADAPTTPRFYVGLGAYSSYYNQLGGLSRGYNSPVRLPVQLVAGYQLRPRLAVQVGVAYSGATANLSAVGLAYNPANPNRGTFFEYYGTSTQRNTSLSALGRYTLTRNPAHRVQFDALGGFTLEHASGFDRGTYSDSLGGTRNVTNYSYRASRNTLLLTAGIGTRFRLSRHVELTYDFTLNKALTNYGSTGQFQGLTSSSALGLRYRFGR
ncbi:outer membrane beta-barrel protein [Hymenobacter sp. UYCo722]|uniref:outer membrane beta-barrel protein n=1 Tax=Hymenobacter sp. UYCo722 TaxID=3156335 RepID=UPI0033955DA9